MGKIFAGFCQKVYNILYSVSYKESYRMQDKDFTRKRKLCFGDLCFMILRGVKNGVQAGINEFLKETKSEVESYSNAAFSKARRKINPEAFRYLSEVSVREFYGNEEAIHTFRGFRVFAVDGTKLNLPNSEELLEIFGSERFAGGLQAQAQVSCMYDVLNDFIVDAKIEKFNTSERILAEEHLQNFSFHEPDRDLILMDRGYPSEGLLLRFEDKAYKYVLRTNKNEFFREVRMVSEPDAIIERKCKDGRILRIRVVTVSLKNGEKETLLTNLFDKELKPEDFAEIYRLRWGIETAYDRLKNQLCTEKFSGTDSICIKQDFYATVFLYNMLFFLESENENALKAINKDENRKYQYKTNSSLAIMTLKANVVELMMPSSRRKFVKTMKRIRAQLLQCLTPIRPNRSFSRNKRRHPSVRFPQNNKFS